MLSIWSGPNFVVWEWVNIIQVMNSIAPYKDVDGFHTLNVGCFCVDEKAFIPATPAGIMEMLRRTGTVFICGVDNSA